MRRLLLVVPALILALGTAAGCGEASDGGEVASANGETESGGTGEAAQMSDEERSRAFVDCMREQGIDLPDPDPDGGGGLLDLDELGVTREELRPALEACREYAPFGGDGDGQLDQETLDQLTEFAQCMRDNGVDLPDPDPNGGFFTGEALPVDPEDPEVQAALEACQDLLSAIRERGGQGGGE